MGPFSPAGMGPTSASIGWSITFKLIIIAVLLVLLLIPSNMVEGSSPSALKTATLPRPKSAASGAGSSWCWGPC